MLWPAARVAGHIRSFRPGPLNRVTGREPKRTAPSIVCEGCHKWVPVDELAQARTNADVVRCGGCREREWEG